MGLFHPDCWSLLHREMASSMAHWSSSAAHPVLSMLAAYSYTYRREEVQGKEGEGKEREGKERERGRREKGRREKGRR